MFFKNAGKVLLAAVIACGFAFMGTRADCSDSKVYTIRIGSISSEAIPEVRAAYEFKKEIEKSSGGRIKVHVRYICTSPSLFFKISRSICSDPGIFSPSRTTGAKRGCISISPSFFNASKTRLTVYRLT